jgi:hypothetical protein
MMSVASAVLGLTFLVDIIENYDGGLVSNCNVTLVLYNLTVPVWLFSSFLRCAHLSAMYSQSEDMLGRGIATSAVDQLSPTSLADRLSRRQNCFVLYLDLMAASLLSVVFQCLHASERLYLKCSKIKDVASGCNRFCFSRKSIPILLTAIFLLHFIFLAIIVPIDILVLDVSVSTVGCTSFDYVLSYVDTVVFMLLAPLFIVSIRNAKDMLYIRTELIITIATVYVSFILYMYFLFGMPNGGNRKKDVTHFIWLFSCSVITFFCSMYLPLIIVAQKRLSEEPVGNCTLEYLNAVLDSPSKSRKLRQIAAKQLSLENIQFLEEMQRAKRGSFDLVNMYNHYIKVDAPNELNIPFEIKNPLEEAEKQGTLTLEAFLPAEVHVKHLVLVNTLLALIKESDKNTKDSA